MGLISDFSKRTLNAMCENKTRGKFTSLQAGNLMGFNGRCSYIITEDNGH